MRGPATGPRQLSRPAAAAARGRYRARARGWPRTRGARPAARTDRGLGSSGLPGAKAPAWRGRRRRPAAGLDGGDVDRRPGRAATCGASGALAGAASRNAAVIADSSNRGGSSSQRSNSSRVMLAALWRLVVAIARVEPLDDSELAALALAQLGTPDPAARALEQRDRDGRLLAGEHRRLLELVRAIGRQVARARRRDQLVHRLVDLAVAAALVEARDEAVDHRAEQVEHRVADLEDAEPVVLRRALGLAQAQLGGVVLGVALAADPALIERAHAVAPDQAMPDPLIPRLLDHQEAGRLELRGAVPLMDLERQVRGDLDARQGEPVPAAPSPGSTTAIGGRSPAGRPPASTACSSNCNLAWQSGALAQAIGAATAAGAGAARAAAGGRRGRRRLRRPAAAGQSSGGQQRERERASSSP